jgi:hypothetical protein
VNKAMESTDGRRETGTLVIVGLWVRLAEIIDVTLSRSQT